MLVSPAIPDPFQPRHSGGGGHSTDDFDTSSLLYLIPMLLHPFTGLVLWLRYVNTCRLEQGL